MNSINVVQLRAVGADNSPPATITTEQTPKITDQGFVLLKQGQPNIRFNAEQRMGQDTCGY